MARLAKHEKHVAETLGRMAQTLHDVHEIINKYLSSWQELSEAGIGAPGWVEHPLHAYALTKHVSLGWPLLEGALTQLKGLSPDISELLERRNKHGVATLEDLTTVAGGVARLHDFYSFNITELSKAHLTSILNPQPTLANVVPTVWDMYCIGSEAARINILNSGVDFLREAWNRYNSSFDTSPSLFSSPSMSSSCAHSNCHPFEVVDDTLQIPKAYQRVTKLHDQVLERKGARSRNHSTHPKPLDKTLARKKKYHKKSQKTISGVLGTHTEGQILYHRLCRGEELRPLNMTAKLYCRYVSNSSPLYLIGPLRMEVHSLSPYVVTFEGVLTSSEARDIQNISAGFLEKSSTFRFNGQQEVTYQRTSST
ncbi:hypothetical protein SK128_015302 [Halocaridina rubra]|uniref:Prolyl 4-hydroxylase N-terminal domain-containing protein n=1 Tax=Halocaridina rubra TaxID=373956 RepID=A0AAN8WTD9_HALRR